MSPAALKRALDPAYIGSPFAQLFQFFEGDVSTPMDLADRSLVLFLDRQGALDQKAEIHGQKLADGRCLFTEADTDHWPSGDYYFELRMDGATVVVGRLPVEQGAAAGGSSIRGAFQPPSAPGLVFVGETIVHVVNVAIALPSGGGGPGGPVAWDDIEDLPLNFPPSPHRHVAGEIDGLQETLDAKAPKDQVDALEDRADLAEASSTALTQRVGLLEDASSSLVSRVGLAEAAAVALDGRLDTVETTLAAALADLSSAEAKLSGIAAGATANDTDVALRARSSHTGTQPISSVSGLQSSLNALAPKSSPAFVDSPTAPTRPAGDNSTGLATTAFVTAAVQAIIGMAPADLDTLAEIAARLQSGESDYAALAGQIAGLLSKSANLSDLTDLAQARINLGLGSAAVLAASALRDRSTHTGSQAISTVTGLTQALSDRVLASVLSAVATSGAYNDLTGRPSLSAVATSGAYGDLTGRPTLSSVATTGAYGDLTGRPVLGNAAGLNVGTTSGTVAAGDDPRFSSNGGSAPDWPIVIASIYWDFSQAAQNQQIPNQAFTKINLTTEVADSHNAFNPATSEFTVPAGQAGYYSIVAKARYADSSGTYSYGIGMGGSLEDQPYFLWSQALTHRNGLLNERIAYLNVGSKVFLYTYQQKGQAVGIAAAEMSIYRIK